MKFRQGFVEEYPVAANTNIGIGAAVITNASGWAVPATGAASGQRILGIATEPVENTGGNGAARVTVIKTGVVPTTPSVTFTQADVGAAVYLNGYDAANRRPTIHNTSTGRTQLGTVVAVESDTVWVRIITV